MQKKDLQSHMIKLHGAPKPHAVSARQGWGTRGSWMAHPVLTWHCSLCLSPACSVPLVPSASCLGRNSNYTRLLSTVGKSCLCVRSVGTGPRAAMGCRCTSRPSTGMSLLPPPRVQAPHTCTHGDERSPPESSTCIHGDERSPPESSTCSLPGLGERQADLLGQWGGLRLRHVCPLPS